jgi:DNA-directed RNA polymerase
MEKAAGENVYLRADFSTSLLPNHRTSQSVSKDTKELKKKSLTTNLQVMFVKQNKAKKKQKQKQKTLPQNGTHSFQLSR